jgi:hypothetical protein
MLMSYMLLMMEKLLEKLSLNYRRMKKKKMMVIVILMKNQKD